MEFWRRELLASNAAERRTRRAQRTSSFCSLIRPFLGSPNLAMPKTPHLQNGVEVYPSSIVARETSDATNTAVPPHIAGMTAQGPVDIAFTRRLPKIEVLESQSAEMLPFAALQC
jgi:hypothetical protein